MEESGFNITDWSKHASAAHKNQPLMRAEILDPKVTLNREVHCILMFSIQNYLLKFLFTKISLDTNSTLISKFLNCMKF